VALHCGRPMSQRRGHSINSDTAANFKGSSFWIAGI